MADGEPNPFQAPASDTDSDAPVGNWLLRWFFAVATYIATGLLGQILGIAWMAALCLILYDEWGPFWVRAIAFIAFGSILPVAIIIDCIRRRRREHAQECPPGESRRSGNPAVGDEQCGHRDHPHR